MQVLFKKGAGAILGGLQAKQSNVRWCHRWHLFANIFFLFLN